MINEAPEPTPIEADREPAIETYEPPTIEMVVTADELEREMHYAGTVLPPMGS